MKRKILSLSILFSAAFALHAQTTQPNRLGQAGASYLLMNGTAQSSGLNGLNIGSADGIESAAVNPAGLSTVNSTEITFARTNWLMGTGVAINNIGFAQSLGEEGSKGVLGISINSMNLGKFNRTTVNQPDGDIGTFSPNATTLGISYGKKFTDHILVGATLRLLNESTTDLNAFGACFDVGVQYRAMENDKLKLGITLRNIGPSMRYGGQGLEYRAPVQVNNPYSNAVSVPTDKYELPSTLSLGGSYDVVSTEANKLSLTAGFISNSFYYNQLGAGFAYSYKEFLVLRASYMYERGIFGALGVTRFSAYTGLSGGATIQVPFKMNKKAETLSKLGIDFSYRTTNPFGGTMCIGAHVNL